MNGTELGRKRFLRIMNALATKEIDPAELKRMRDENRPFQLVDIREPYEAEICTLGGDLIPMGEVLDRLGELRKDVPVVMHCRSGSRATAMIEALSSRYGFTNLINLKGGILAYAHSAMNLRDRIKLYLKGMAMGAADTVPGVSGGTIAFISGIYEELIDSIGSIGFETLVTLRKQGVAAAWRQINGNFLVTLLAGIATSIVLLVRPITWMLKNEPVLLWSFFFGLIGASVWLCGRLVRKWTVGPFIGFLIGTCAAIAVGLLNASPGSDGPLFFFLAGSVAICAMILPGISGSFILLLLGAYGPVLNAVKEFDLSIIVVFAAGCVVGLMAFSRLLGWMFNHHHDLTVASLSGFLLGSLTIIWPWKEVRSVKTVHSGRPDEHLEPFLTSNVWPSDFNAITEMDTLLGITDKEPQVFLAILLMLFGAALLLGLEYVGSARR